MRYGCSVCGQVHAFQYHSEDRFTVLRNVLQRHTQQDVLAAIAAPPAKFWSNHGPRKRKRQAALKKDVKEFIKYLEQETGKSLGIELAVVNKALGVAKELGIPIRTSRVYDMPTLEPIDRLAASMFWGVPKAGVAA